ncbi:glycosyltransferase family protein [Siphonobacter sp. SORGH_AS_1065]|uniref:glycosyltransferase family protein n=1 Tax=Siphonobacter sp. SORGH_AS_1065 TaxID=3041795 RepID=UPI002789DC1A|nr:glycosyltransferase family protein [Siphonobacter sp. SORGH_AS_1065]MDQ1086555.1 uncharacterized protein (TIGR00661 family) [Siphonobacter sp. SORGH_AS_1065]
MRILFFIQGEGRGHQTQAIAMAEILQKAGHELVGAIVGTTQGRGIPVLLEKHLSVEMRAFPSPALLYSEKSKSLAVWKTFWENLKQGSVYMQQAGKVEAYIQEKRPDVIINFYEMLCGLWRLRYKTSIPVLSIAHQYLLQHSQFRLPTSSFLHHRIVNTVTRLSALGTTRKLALSFYEMPDDTKQDIYVIPPLLRAEVKVLVPQKEDFILAYMTHYKLEDDLRDWCRRHPETNVVAFWAHPQAQKLETPLPNYSLHRVDAHLFLDAMRRCRGLVSTSGFEAICEAMYLGKPVMLFPTPQHFEQAVNAIDAARAGAGIQATSFLEMDRFLDYLPTHQPIEDTFRLWQHQLEEKIRQQLVAVTG